MRNLTKDRTVSMTWYSVGETLQQVIFISSHRNHFICSSLIWTSQFTHMISLSYTPTSRQSPTAQSVEHRTSTMEVMGLNPPRWSLRIIFGLYFNCLSYFTTAKISLTLFFICSSLIWSLSYTLRVCHSPHITGINWTHTWPAFGIRLHSSVSRASHQYHGGHGFESRWSLRTS